MARRQRYARGMKRFLPLILLLAAASLPGFGQSSSTTSSDGTNNTFLAAIESVGGRTIQVFLTVTYADDATEDQYVDVANYRTETTAAIVAVANKNAPLEVFSAAVLNSLFNKYTQVRSLLVQVAYASQTVNQQTVVSQRTRPQEKPPTNPDPVGSTAAAKK